MPGCNRTTSSLSHKDSSRETGKTSESRPRRPALAVFVLAAAITIAGGLPSAGWAQTPTPPPSSTDPSQPATPSDKPGQPSEQGQPQKRQSEPVQPSTIEPQAPLQQYLIQQPGRPLVTPATPPGTSLPPWTPPAPPAPSQTNLPAPLFVPGAAGGAPAAGIPGLTIPGAFAPTTTTFRGATLEFHPTLRLAGRVELEGRSSEAWW